VALVVAILLAVFVVPAPWGWVLIGAAAVYEVGSTWAGWHWSRTRRQVVGTGALVGRAVEVDGEGWARLDGARWRVRGVGPGERGRVVGVEGLTLVAERVEEEGLAE
jgi:membrane protein implicated in regulation of membrane protease activity